FEICSRRATIARLWPIRSVSAISGAILPPLFTARTHRARFLPRGPDARTAENRRGFVAGLMHSLVERFDVTARSFSHHSVALRLQFDVASRHAIAGNNEQRRPKGGAAMNTHGYTYQATLAASERIHWRVEDLIGDDKRLDFSRPFLPESLARVESLSF